MKIKNICIFILLFSMSTPLSGLVAAERLGTTDYGYVTKNVYGNPDSYETIVVVTGMHPLESGSHKAMISKLKNTPQNSNKRYINYNINVTKDPYDQGRMNGQLLAQKFIVPDVDYNPLLVMDIHENKWKDSGYKYGRFLYLKPIDITHYYADSIMTKISFLAKYTPPKPTSPSYMAIPLANKGMPVIIYENYNYDDQKTKNTHMNLLVNTLDEITPYTSN